MKSEIPNITGCWYWWDKSCDLGVVSEGSLKRVGGASPRDIQVNNFYNEDTTTKMQFDASLSSDKYGDYTEVRPLYESCWFVIRY